MLKLVGHKGDVRCVAFAPHGRLVSGGGDKTVRVWNPLSGECVATFKVGHVVYALAVAPDGKSFACGGRPATNSTSNFATVRDFDGKVIGRYEARTFARVWHGGTVGRQAVGFSIWGLSFSADGAYLAAALRKPGGANIPDGAGGFYWPVGKGDVNTPLPGTDIYAAAFAPTGRRIAVTRQRRVVFLDGPDAVDGLTCSFSASWSAAVAFVPGAELAAVASNSFIEFVNPVRAAKAIRVKTGSRTIVALAASPDGKTLLAGGRPGAVEVYDTATRALKNSYDFGIGGLHSLAYAPDGLTFAASGDEGLVVCDSGE
jgi:WD40 repeat protein